MNQTGKQQEQDDPFVILSNGIARIKDTMVDERMRRNDKSCENRLRTLATVEDVGTLLSPDECHVVVSE